MKRIKHIYFLGIIFIGFSYSSLVLSKPMSCSILGNYKHTIFTDLGPNKRQRGYLCYIVKDHEKQQGVLTLKHINNKGDWNIVVGKSFDQKSRVVDGTIPYKNNSGTTNELIWLPGNSYGEYVVVVYPTTDTPSKACLIFHRFDTAEIVTDAIIFATAQSLLEIIFENEGDNQKTSNHKSRAIAGGLSIIQNKNIAEFGYDMVLSEISIQLSNAFGGGSWLTSFGINYFSSYLRQSTRFLFDRNMMCTN